MDFWPSLYIPFTFPFPVQTKQAYLMHCIHYSHTLLTHTKYIQSDYIHTFEYMYIITLIIYRLLKPIYSMLFNTI